MSAYGVYAVAQEIVRIQAAFAPLRQQLSEFISACVVAPDIV